MADWKMGDDALCVNDGPLPNNAGGLDLEPLVRRGCLYKVYGISVCELGHICLFVGAGLGEPLVDRFIKVTPPEADEFDREVIELMKPAKQPLHDISRRMTAKGGEE